jgi:hypothetical protein
LISFGAPSATLSRLPFGFHESAQYLEANSGFAPEAACSAFINAQKYVASAPVLNLGTKDLLVGQKKPLEPKHVWSIRVRLEIAGSKRDLAIFNLAIDSKLRACDLVKLRLDDICSGLRVPTSNDRAKEDWSTSPIRDHGTVEEFRRSLATIAPDRRFSIPLPKSASCEPSNIN